MRKLIRLATNVMCLTALACVPIDRVSAFQIADVIVSPRAARIHNATFVFDGHNDLPYTLKKVASSSFVTMDIAKPQPTIHTDIPRLLQGNVGGQYWSVYVPAATASRGTALLETLEQIQIVHAMINKYPETFAAVSNYQDIVRARRQGKIASLIGVEGGHSIENSVGNLHRLYDLGARYMTLTHSDTLKWADSATDDAKHQGLNAFGEEIVRQMNSLGMIVDLSHVSQSTMHDALDTTKAPIMFSHSSARSVANHVRNVPDSVLERMRSNGGIVMVNFFSGFVDPEAAVIMSTMFDVSRELRLKYSDDDEFDTAVKRWRAANPYPRGTIYDVVDHIDHIVKIAGIDHVGIGSDFDGVSKLPVGLEDVSTYPRITQILLDRGYSRRDVDKIMSSNMMRVIRQVERVAAQQ
ncbi:MAG: membrane dipeptidase [Planctomycetaceae bacterium]|jgi:membrane dipeptidase|nr:membrane dipeptidase [Planctomycetaceae bacterium]MBT4725296.1 membrane dipeptidase [Planctomycetaceae bacterium]MBT4845442.1 membrane dipeptidase [Planctomycetaceae bacterium]MBT5123251.1 membrane dipeptidase [Planctomycetaceae bacterium]MBT5600069.1 membrane dipeptidase [Planctomycetaceae bacterium]